MTTEAAKSPRQVRITLGGETRFATEENWNAIADELVAKFGGVPHVAMIDAAPPSNDVAPLTVIQGGEHDVIGEARSKTDLEAAREAGFAPKRTIYTRGTRVIQLGTDNARQARSDFEAKPTVADYCQELARTVAKEDRKDLVSNVRHLRMNGRGEIQLGEARDVASVEERAFPSLVQNLQMPPGAGSYLSAAWPELRAMNVNAWTEQWGADEAEYAQQGHDDAPDTLVLRTRRSGDTRAVFAAVTESYTAFDVDKIAEAIRLATPPGARGTVTYDGYKARFEVLFHSDVKPEEFVAGEFFRAGVVISTDDTGGGSIQGSAVVFQNLCLNLIVIDEAKQDLFRIRHVGSIRDLARKFSQGFQSALGKLDHFVKAWGYAARENVLDHIPASERPIRLADALPGLFNGIIERELVPVRGRRVETVKRLVQAWEADKSSATIHHKGATRAAIANAFTRFAHETPQATPWIEDEIQQAAGALIFGKAPLPYLPIKL